MSPYHAAHIGCRIGALFMFKSAVANGMALWQQVAYSKGEGYEGFMLPTFGALVVTTVVNGLLSFLMWDRAGWLAKVVAGPKVESLPETETGNWGGVALRGVALFMLLDYLPAFVEAIRNKFFSELPRPDADATFWPLLTVMSVSLFLLVGAERFAAGARWYFNPSGSGDDGESK